MIPDMRIARLSDKCLVDKLVKLSKISPAKAELRIVLTSPYLPKPGEISVTDGSIKSQCDSVEPLLD